ncbi:MAG: TonB-dependent receptor [Nostoc sp.]|uniref:TonB-dependent siderophore receptor n=1 Tax=Nostoc sp. TaxID=1180 RepID=UPI002FFC8299
MNNLQNPEPDEFIHQVHSWEAKGYEREIEVHPNLWLSIYDTENYYDSLEKTSEWDHPVQFQVLLAGKGFEELGGQIGEGYTLISGSGVQRAMLMGSPKGRYMGVDIHMPPELLKTFFPAEDGDISPQLKFLTKSNDWQTLIYPQITTAIQGVAQQIVNCPYRGMIKRMYLQGKIQELMALQLAPILAEQDGLQPSPRLKAQTITRIHYAKDILLSRLEDEPIELVVTGEQDGYNAPNATTATRTDTPLRDIPQSIQVIPNQVIRDQGVNRLQDAVRNNAPGVSQYFGQNQAFVIRGFRQDFNLRNGFRTSSAIAPFDVDLANIERIEVLRGPASVLFGQLQPGGVINTVTKQPLTEPYYSVNFTGGQFSFYRSELDFSGPLTDDGNLRYRLNTAYQNNGSFRDFVSEQRFFVAPVLQWNISKNTTLTVDFSYTYNDPVVDFGVVALSDASLVLPINRALFYPSLDRFTEEQYQASYRFEHKFSDNWQLRNGFSFYNTYQSGGYTYVDADFRDDRFLDKLYSDDVFLLQDYEMQTDLIGKFATGSIKHQLLVGFDLSRATSYFTSGSARLPTIDIFNPNYTVTRPDVQINSYGTTFTDSLGIYIQDQIDITDNLHLLVGGRFDFTEQYDSLDIFFQGDQAFSPRVGIVYQPIKPISLYASYSQSFTPVIGRSRTQELFEPERGNQYEVGIKADITNKLSATLAAFQITKSNVLTSDPVDPINFSLQIGEQRSRGVEFTIGGEILPGWNIIAGYAYTDARVTEDNDIPVGELLQNVPKNAANLWTTYEIQSGDYKGLGFGFGLVFVGEQQGEFPNSNFQIPSYVRTDAALFYHRDNWRVGINVNNLFDTGYYETATRRTLVYPGAPMNVQATISYEF